MAKRWSEFKRFVAGPFRRKRESRSVAQQEAPTTEERRHHHLQGQVAVIDRELLVLARAISAKRDPEDAAAALVIRRGLVRARDLRYKASLLEAEVERGSTGEDLAARASENATREIHVPRGVRRAAEKALATAEFGKRSQRTTFVRAIGHLLGPSPRQRLRAVESLRRLRSPASVPLFKAALAIDDDPLRIKCLEALAELGTPCALDDVNDLLISPNHLLRLAALRALSRIAAGDAIPTCIGCLADKNSEVRRSAAAMLGWIGARQAGSALAVMLRDEEAKVRTATAETLGLLGSEQEIYALIRAIGDEEVSVRRAAKIALDRILASRIDLDVEQGMAALMPQVDALVSWWIKARVSGEPWRVPANLENADDRGKGLEVVPLFTNRRSSRHAGHEAGDRRKAKHGSS